MDLSPNARLLFIGLWNFCDDAGIHPASTKRLKAEIMPADDVRSEDVRRMIDECIKVDLVREYEIDGEPYWAVTGWHHQKIDQPSYKYPNEDGTVPEGPAKRRQSSKSRPEPIGTDELFGERSPPEGKGREGKGEERKREAARGSRLPPDWKPSEAELQWAKGARTDLTIESEVDKFRDYWTARAGKEGVKLDWAATFRNWIRNAKNWGNGLPQTETQRNRVDL